MKTKNNWVWIALSLAVIGIILILAAGFINPYAQSSVSASSDTELALESKLKTLCENVNGVSDVTVAVFFNANSSELMGVCILCENGDDPQIQYKLISMISSACGIGSNKIFIADSQK